MPASLTVLQTFLWFIWMVRFNFNHDYNQTNLCLKVTVNCVPQIQLDSVRFKPQSAMVVAFTSCQNESNANIFYFDLVARKWSPYKYSTCLSTPKDVLSFCQRIYPKLSVMNIYQMESVLKFNAKVIESGHEETKYGRPYKCLHGQFKEAKLAIPSRCQIQHLFSQTDCKSDEHWRLLSNEKCKSLGYYLNSSNLLQWCDAFSSGISSFSGIEFVCCPTLTSSKTKTDKKNNKEAKFMEEDGTETSTDEEEDIDDENDYYQAEKPASDDSSSNDLDDKVDQSDESVQQTTNKIISSGSKTKKSGRSTISYATVFFIIGFSCTIVFAFIYVRILKPGKCCKPSKDEVILINSFNTDDTHVNSMQQNGYENPTYRFFEQKA